MPKHLFKAGAKNLNWKGGRTIASNGYVLLKMPGHPLADVRGYVYEHRLVAQKKLGRALKAGERAHHRDECKTSNRPDNIEPCPTPLHHAVHHRKPGSKYQRDPENDVNSTIDCACGCGEHLLKFDRWGRVRKFITGHNLHG